MPALKEKERITAEEYLALEEKAEFRSEFDDGVIVAMSGGTLNHAQICSNLIRSIGNKAPATCRALGADMKVAVETFRRFFYPDVLVVCGQPTMFEDRRDTLVNPLMIVEVLSESTEARDRGTKMLAYRAIETLREYVLVSQDRAVVEQFSKNDNGDWIHRATIGLKSSVRLESVGIDLDLNEIYERVEFDED